MKVRLTTFARSDEELLRKFSKRYLAGLKNWKDLEFVIDDSYDRLVILTYPFRDVLEEGYHEDRALTFMTEPSLSYYAKPHPTSKTMGMHFHLPFFPIDFNLQQQIEKNKLDVLKKNEVVSVTVSELSDLPGHKARLKLTHVLDKLFVDGLDIFGRPATGEFFQLLSNYKGPLQKKYDGLWSYQYHLACENCFETGYFTEKIVDPLMMETLCFYDGCPDIENYIDPRACIKIDVNNIEKSVQKIVKAIYDNEWKKRLKYIKQQKKRFLTDLHPFNLIWLAVHDKAMDGIYNF